MTAKGRISYEPFLFGLAVLGILLKLFQANRERELRFDWVLGALILVFLVACLLWFINTRRRRQATKLDVAVRTGKVRSSTVLGAEAAGKDDVRTNISTGDVTGSQITGFREK